MFLQKGLPVMRRFIPAITTIVALLSGTAQAGAGLAPHKAVYDIKMVSRHSGAPIVDIGGQMTYEVDKSCDAWITRHNFKLNYQYPDSPGLIINSDFSTYESFDGKQFSFTARRRSGEEEPEIFRGKAVIIPGQAGKASFTIPKDMAIDMPVGTLFPMGHTQAVLDHINQGKKFYHAPVFDGSDDEGVIQINSIIGKSIAGPAPYLKTAKNIDHELLKGKGWNLHMGFFPEKDDTPESDYEMKVVFHENGVISDMLIDYHDFSVTQKLVRLEARKAEKCAP